MDGKHGEPGLWNVGRQTCDVLSRVRWGRFAKKQIKKRASMHVYSMHVETPVYTGVHTSVCLYSVGHRVTLLLVLVSVRIPTRRFVPWNFLQFWNSAQEQLLNTTRATYRYHNKDLGMEFLLIDSVVQLKLFQPFDTRLLQVYSLHPWYATLRPIWSVFTWILSPNWKNCKQLSCTMCHVYHM